MFKLAMFPNFPIVLATTRRSRRNRMAEFWAGAAEGLAMKAHYDRLASLSQAELRRMGLTRNDIGPIVVRGH